MDEKKIFLAYTYRALTLLYRHLYKVRADLIFDNMYAHHDEEECGCKDCMPTVESSLALHYRVAKEIESMYNVSKKLDRSLCQCIDKLLNNELPTLDKTIGAGLIRYNIDRYNPIFSSLLSQLK